MKILKSLGIFLAVILLALTVSGQNAPVAPTPQPEAQVLVGDWNVGFCADDGFFASHGVLKNDVLPELVFNSIVIGPNNVKEMTDTSFKIFDVSQKNGTVFFTANHTDDKVSIILKSIYFEARFIGTIKEKDHVVYYVFAEQDTKDSLQTFGDDNVITCAELNHLNNPVTVYTWLATQWLHLTSEPTKGIVPTSK